MIHNVTREWSCIFTKVNGTSLKFAKFYKHLLWLEF